MDEPGWGPASARIAVTLQRLIGTLRQPPEDREGPGQSQNPIFERHKTRRHT
jgi:hypothetical protein